MIIEVWAKTDVGKQRSSNEDCHYVDPDRELILMLDGMGGHQAGEVASRLAMDTISSFYKQHCADSADSSDIFDSYDHRFTYHTNLLRQATFIANRVILEKSLENSGLIGMGSTLAGMAIHDFTVSLINVGDSRMYLIRNGVMEQISKDHTLAEDQVERGIMTRDEVRDSQLRHILSSVIGVDPRIRIHMDELTVFPGDLFLLCTDGLTAVMSDEEILQEILRDKPGPLTLDRLIDEVNLRGGPDNTTLALAAFSAQPQPAEESKLQSFFAKTWAIFHSRKRDNSKARPPGGYRCLSWS
ncbi:MAG: PP2C family protein-serine/threonine phosphatase [Desulfomonilaceae bacterium]